MSVPALRRFANKMGWSGLRRRTYENDSTPIIWYDTRGSEGVGHDLFLQFNECPFGQVLTYTVAVYAIRYRLCTGWHAMRLTPDGRCDDAEVRRLHPWLHRSWFNTLEGRRAFRAAHPECCGWSWKLNGEAHLPYEVVDAANCVTARKTE